MTLTAIALFGLLFVAIFGAKAAQGVLKFIGGLAVVVVALLLVAVIASGQRTSRMQTNNMVATIKALR